MSAGTTAQLPPPPARVLDEAGRPRTGRYAGHVDADWSAAPLSRWKRLVRGKRWLYTGIGTPECFLAVAIIDLGWVSSAFTYLFDRRTREHAVNHAWNGMAGAAKVTTIAGAGASARFHARKTDLSIERGTNRDAWTLRLAAPGLVAEATLDAAAAPPTLCAIAEPPGAFGNCTHKSVGLPVRGFAEAGGRRYSLDGASAAVDHTSGLLARETIWRWASASGPGAGFNLVEGFNGSVENAVWIGGNLVPVGDTRIAFDEKDPMRPWSVKSEDGIVDLEFRPEGKRAADTNLLIAVSRYIQPIGTFHGTLRAPGTAPFDVRDLAGVTEWHVAKW